VLVDTEAQCAVTKLGVDVLLPQRRRLEDVAIGIDRAVLDHRVRLVDGLVRGNRERHDGNPPC